MTTETASTVDERLDRIEAMLTTVAEELAIARRQREDFNELKEDLMGISKDAFQSTVNELDEIAPFVRTGTFKELAKRLLRNADNFSRLMDFMEGTMGLIDDGQPITKELFNDMLATLDKLERRGHFDLMRQGMTVYDQLAMIHRETDLEAVAPLSLWQLLKEMRSPEIRKAMTCMLIYLKGTCESSK